MAVTITRTVPAHSNPAHQTVQYCYKRVKYNDVSQTNSSRFSVAVPIFTLPAHCMPMETVVRIVTAFTSGDLCLGTSVSGSSAGIVSSIDVVSATSGITYVVDKYYGTYSTVDTPVYFYTGTTGVGAGVADVWQAYLPGPARDA
jgi:hypothetical protein